MKRKFIKSERKNQIDCAREKSVKEKKKIKTDEKLKKKNKKLYRML